MTSPLDRAQWLASPEGSRALAAAERVWDETGADPLRAGARLRAEGDPLHDPATAPALLDQVSLRRLARDRYGIDASDLLLTRDGLEAGTRPEVADHRAAVLAASGARQVLDLTAGLGFDTAAFVRIGLHVIAVERDPVIATYLARNCPTAHVVAADATAPDALTPLLGELAPNDVVFVDPARRDPTGPRQAQTGRARPERDPERWSPPWSWVAAIPHPRVAAKVAPGFSPPPGRDWQAQWVSVDRTVVECALYSWDAVGSSRSAVIVTDDGLDPVPTDPAAAQTCAKEIGTWLHEIDPAVMQSGGADTLARDQRMARLDPRSSWLTGDAPAAHAALRSHRVVTRLDGPAREQRRRLHDLGITRATVKCRDVTATPAAVLRQLGMKEGNQHAIVLTFHAGRPVTVVVEPGVPSVPSTSIAG